MFKINVGTLDRAARIVIGLGLLSLVITGPRTPWGFIGIIPIATALFATCPLYSVLGISTCARRSSHNETSDITESRNRATRV